jgi:prepilin-type processing-associated H-X9-DG protein
MNARLLAIGTSVPAGTLTREGAAALSQLVAPSVPASVHMRLHERSGVARRGGMIFDPSGSQTLYAPAKNATDKGPSTAMRLAGFVEQAANLAESAGRDALARAEVAAAQVTHLVTASCTGAEAPGVDILLMRRLGLRATVRRTHVGFMGCHAAINAIATAAAFAMSDPDAAVLVVCVELCTLHMHYGDRTDQLIANALFADGSAAAVIAGEAFSQSTAAERTTPRIVGVASKVFDTPDGTATHDRMRWEVTDHGFAMTLAKDVPELLAASVPGWVEEALGAMGMGISDIGAWAVHPGGPRIVQALVDVMALRNDVRERAVADAMRVLREHGNMSSATILFMLERMLREQYEGPVAALAFGPGLAGEMMVLANA